jgi:outer membrane receptor protein involved in Fe transport
VSNDSYFTVSTPATRADGTPAQLVDFSYWQALSSSWSVFQDFDVRLDGPLSFTAGLKYEEKDLQKAYDTVYGPQVPADALDASLYPYPSPPERTPLAQNHITTRDEGVYVQTKYRLDERHQLNVGLRFDHNSRYGGATTVRAGYVGTYGRWGAKALYGEAFQEPTPRLLYGGWTGSGSDPNLDPQRSRTLEVSGSYKSPRLSGLLSVYRVENEATIVNTAASAENLGNRTVLGLDVHGQALVPVAGLKRVRLWGYYSRILKADEKRIGGGADFRIADLADDKVHLGVTAIVGDLTATLRGRRIGARPTVETNPVRVVPGYTSVDATVSYRDLLVKGARVSLRVTNLLDHDYFHPGVRDAEAGVEPGRFDASGRWLGSQGFYNSLLPQPGRAALVSIDLDF